MMLNRSLRIAGRTLHILLSFAFYLVYFLVIDLPLILLGLVVIKVLIRRKAYTERQSGRWPDRRLPQFTSWYVFGNIEDGIDGMRGWAKYSDGSLQQQWWLDKTADLTQAERIYKWSALRNSLGNMRFIPPFGFIICPDRVRSVGNFFHPDDLRILKGFRWHFAWCGLYSGLWLQYGRFRFRIGWKIYPSDVHGVEDYRAKGCGFALQLQGKR